MPLDATRSSRRPDKDSELLGIWGGTSAEDREKLLGRKKKRRTQGDQCFVCGRRDVLAKNRCRACYTYRQGHGVDREEQRARPERRTGGALTLQAPPNGLVDEAGQVVHVGR